MLDPGDGRIGADILQLPDRVSDVTFSPNESRVLLKTGRWIHRALVTPTGLIWTDTVRAPKAMNGSKMAFGSTRGPVSDPARRTSDQSGDRVLLLANDTGVTELAEIRFGYTEGPALFGSRSDLLRDWSEKLRGAETSAFVREGF